METLRREYLPFHCPVCGLQSNAAQCKPGATLRQRLSPVYVCQACKTQLRPRRYWLTLVFVCFFVFPPSTMGAVWATTWLNLAVGPSVWIAAATGVLVSIIAFQLIARALISWRQNEASPVDP